MKMYGLADCNSFFASCERVFRPDLKGRPIIVLSNNDGCVIALSAEAKQAGIRRGTPLFKAKPIIDKIGAAVFSSNYTLYQDFSDRVMSVLSEMVDSVEKYSIDESFFILNGNSVSDMEKKIRDISRILFKQTGIPVSVGAARSKTLAKVANHIGKKENGWYLLTQEKEQEVLKNIPVSDIWGIGWCSANKLAHYGIQTAFQFTQKDSSWVRRNFSMPGLHTQQELLGFSCIKGFSKTIASFTSTISFKRPIVCKEDMLAALVSYCEVVAAKLISSNMMASGLSIQMLTDRFQENYENCFQDVRLPYPTNYIPNLVRAARFCLDISFRQGIKYKSAGVSVWDFTSRSAQQPLLFDYNEINYRKEKEDKLASFIAEKHVPVFCSSGRNKKRMDYTKRDFLSPRYTTRWSDIPTIC